MLKQLVAIVIGTLIATSPAAAFQCPVLIQQLNDAVVSMKPTDPKLREGRLLIGEANKLHEAGRHADSIATAEKAARVLGVSLKLAKMTPAQEEQVRAAEQRVGK